MFRRLTHCSPELNDNAVPFVEDLLDTFFTSLNKYISSSVIRTICDWFYGLAHNEWTKRIMMPGWNE